ncbi:MAG: ABC transporter ATP-binding protein [Candidatus Bathyarchaeia archaeon]
MEDTLVSVEGLTKYFPVKGGILQRVKEYIKAVDRVSYRVLPHETFGIVGESGCGKTTLARTMLRLIEATEGAVYFQGENIMDLQGERLKEFRRDAQIVFQNPFSALHPRKMIRDIVSEPLKTHYKMDGDEIVDKLSEILAEVGLTREHMYRYPHEFSGGQRQRIGVARAMILRPKLIVLDEPTAALDVSVQAKILNLFKELQKDYALTYILISHDFSIIDYLCDRIAVMYLGRIVEVAPKREIFHNPLHPYTKALISAIPVPDVKRKSEPIILKGEVPSPINPPSGCHFRTRCPLRTTECAEKEPSLEKVDEGHYVACPLYDRPWREE